MSYEIAVKCEGLMQERKFKVMIADEAHMLKNWKTRRVQSLMPILMGAKRVILISGTPIISKPQEIYNLLKILRPDITPPFPDYASRYCDPKPSPYGLDYSGNSCLKELNFLLTSSVMIRRLKADVLRQLPPKRRQKLQIRVDSKLAQKIKAHLGRVMASEKDFKRAAEALERQEDLEDQNEDDGFFSAF